MALPRENRLIKKSDFNKVFKEGKAVKGSFLFIKSKMKKGKTSFGFIIPKKILPKATARNRLKRVLSETAKDYIKDNSSSNRDIIVLINKNGEEKLLCAELTKLLKFIN